jgi:hypothetical protein
MQFFKLSVFAAALAVVANAGAGTISFPPSLLTPGAQALQKHRDVVEAAVANSAYGQGVLARYDNRDAGPVNSADMWWMLDYDESRAVWLAAGQILQDRYRNEGEGGDDQYAARRSDNEPDLMTMLVHQDELAAVPEADAWALLLAGLAAVGAIVRRRAPAPRRA